MKTTTLLSLLCAAPLLLFSVSCEKKGPAEQVGEAIDDAAKAVEDAVDPKGPAEKVGEALDNAGEKVGEAIDKAVNN